jgi:UTP--glucose-1-phosphate uridylyltransferase
MLPIVDKPAIQYAVEEAVRAGIDDILIITGRNKRAIEDHFDRAVELEFDLEAKGKHDQLKQVRAITDMARLHYTRQGKPKGLGHAVSMARAHVGDEPFVVMLPDELMEERAGIVEGMLDAYARVERPVIALMEVPNAEISAYGCAAVEPENGLLRVTSLVEKPTASEAPSNLALIGRYVLTPDIFDAIARLVPGTGGELQLTDAIAIAAAEAGVYSVTFSEGRFDTGNKLDYLKAVVHFALERHDIGPAFREFLISI